MDAFAQKDMKEAHQLTENKQAWRVLSNKHYGFGSKWQRKAGVLWEEKMIMQFISI